MPIQFLKIPVESAARMWAIKPFKYPADLEREGKKTRLAVARYISEFQDSAVCTCTLARDREELDFNCPVHGRAAVCNCHKLHHTVGDTLVTNPHCPVHAPVFTGEIPKPMPACICADLPGNEQYPNCPVHGSSKLQNNS